MLAFPIALPGDLLAPVGPTLGDERTNDRPYDRRCQADDGDDERDSERRRTHAHIQPVRPPTTPDVALRAAPPLCSRGSSPSRHGTALYRTLIVTPKSFSPVLASNSLTPLRFEANFTAYGIRSGASRSGIASRTL